MSSRGKLYSCGWGSDGQTGLGHFDTTSEATEVKGDIEGENIVKVASKVDCVLALNGNGGRILKKNLSLLSLRSWCVCVLSVDRGELFGWGNSEYGQFACVTEEQQICRPTRIKTPSVGKIIDIACGGSICIVLNG